MRQKPWIRPADVAAALGLSVKTVYEQIAENKFPWIYRRSGRAIFIDARDFGLIAENSVESGGGNQEEVLANAS